MLCPECKTEMVFGVHPIITKIGAHAVESRSLNHERCPTCGYYELAAEASELLEIQAPIVVMSDVPEPGPKAVRVARKAMALSQSALASELGLSQETISRYETGVLSIPAEYRLALAGLLGREERRVRGYEPACGRLLPTGTE